MTTVRSPRPGYAGAWRWVVLAGVTSWGGATALWVSGCAGALFTAPPGSAIFVQANPEFIPAHGGVSTITVGLIEPAGTYVPDGTVVQFFTTLGRIDREARTRNGIARANLVSDSRSGTARVTAVSGGEAPVSTTSSTTVTSTLTPTTTLRLAPQAFGESGGAGMGFSGDTASGSRASESVDVTIGNPNVVAIHLRAVPPRITISNSTHVIATVLGSDGNPVPNVAVHFYADSTPGVPGTGDADDIDPSTEFMDSAGRPIFTNQNGEAEDVMRTRRAFAGAARVRAVVAGATDFITADITIPIL